MLLSFKILAYGSLLINMDEDYSSKKLYFDINSPTLLASKLGLITTMRVDLSRMIFGFSEKSKLNSEKNNSDIEDVTGQTIEYNKINIDFDKLISNENDKGIIELHNYFKNAYATSKNKYTGMFKGKNLIYILGESFYPIAIDKNLTPTLYKLYSSGFNFTNFYTPLYPVSTSDGEYITATSLIPKEGVWSGKVSSSNYFPYVLGNAFKSIGYQALAYHNHKGAYYSRDLYIPNWGYNYKACKMGLDINCRQWPESDLEMVDATYKEFVSKEPFLTYYITVSGHLNYTKLGNSMVKKNWDYVKNLPYSDKVKSYIACNIELDKALENLIKYLTEAKTLDDTVIAISSDHYPYGLTLDEINEISKNKRDNDFEKHHSSFILWNNKMSPIKIDKIASSLDILPTLLNLFGFEYDSRILMGRDILSDSDSLVIFANRSWITDNGKYNSITKEFTNYGNIKNSDGYIKDINDEIYNKFYLSKKIIETDYYRKLFK
jgi:phosphoglycerol transferase MdoB-like AlkP superfamily enzyme